MLERDTSKLEKVKAPFPRMSYDDAVKKLQAKGSEIQWGGDFGNTDETLLTEDMDVPLMVDRYPAEIKAFYFETDPERPELALGVDVIAPEGYGEIIGGGQRVHDYDLLVQRLEEHGLAARGLRVVSRSAKVRRCAARRIRHGRGAMRCLDLRPGARARNDSVPAHAVPHEALIRMRQSCIAIIGAPMDLGAGRRGVDMGPSALRLAGLDARLRSLRL